MQTFMLRLDAAIHRRRRLVLAAWLAVFAVAVPFALQQGDHLTGGGFGVPGSSSQAVEDAIERDFPTAARATLGVVVIPREGAGPAELRSAVDEIDAAATAVADVDLPAAGRAQALRAADAASGPFVVGLRTAVDDLEAADVASGLRERLELADGASSGSVQLSLVGQGALWAGLQDVSKESLEKAEATGFPIVLLILLAVFGSLAAASLPLMLGVVSVLVTGGLIFALSRTMEMSVFVTNMASMIGIGVAVDYSLFVLARYREEVHAGRAPDRARAVALATSGVAVLFSGLTVIVSLAGLYMVDATAIRSMALGAILVVAVSMLAAATLLPALISLLGHRAHAEGRTFSLIARVWRTRAPRRRGSTRPGATPVTFWSRWTATVTRRPVLAAVGTTAVLLALAIPALSLQTSNGALRQFPADDPTRVGFEVAAGLTGPGASAPVKVVVRVPDGASVAGGAGAALVADVRAAMAADPQVVRVAAPVVSTTGDSALVVATPRADGEAPATKALVDRLRVSLPAVAAGASLDVGGSTAAQNDFSDLVSGSMWKIVLFVMALSYVVLLVLLRSAILPIKAVIANLLSVGAAYGVLVVVFQWGWFDGFLGFQSPGYIDTITPPLVLAVVFGLSMDYEVFLLSRIRERFGATGDTRRAVAEGIAASARTITSAALIMVAVFLVFVSTGVPSIKQLGLGNAVAIAVDATLVRLVLVPAVMEMLGRWNWWLPAPLDRILPQVDMEELATEAVPARPAPAPAADRDAPREPAGVA